MAHQIFTLPKQVNVSATEALRLVPGAKATFYVTGTVDLTDVFTTSALDTAHTNPVVADANGVFAPIYLDPDVTYKLTLTDASDVLIYTVDPVNDQLLSQAIIGEYLHPQTDEEIAASVTPVNYAYAAGAPFFDARRYGLSTTGTATANSTALQDACDVAEAAGGGTVYIASGTYSTNAPIIVPAGVHILGEDEYSAILKKTTNTASSVTDATVRFWDSATVGFPICVLHFIEGASTVWSGTCKNIQVQGDTSSPNDTAVEYGFFFGGMANGRVQNCLAQYVEVGFFWGALSSIYSEVSSNVAANVQRGFYQDFATSTNMRNNFVAHARFAGYYWSAHYSHFNNNACDAGGGTWKVGTTEICLAYEIKSCLGGTVTGNGCEVHNGSVWHLNGNTCTEFSNNLGHEITSDYTGGGDIVALEMKNNIRCTVKDNLCNIIAMTGTAGRHFTTKIGTEFGPYTYARNFFVDVINQTTDGSTFWTNTSGTIQEEYESGTYTVTLTGVDSSVTGTARWERHRDKVNLYVPDLQGTSDATSATLTGMPASIRPARERRCIIQGADNSIFNQVSALIQTSGTITLQYGPTETTWTASGTKRIINNELNYGLT